MVKLVRAFVLLLVSVMSAAWLQADVMPGSDFIITMNHWNPFEEFTGVANQPQGFQSSHSLFVPCPKTDESCEFSDPDIDIDLGGLSQGVFLAPFTFMADANGMVNMHFQNLSGVDFTALDITTMGFPRGDLYVCGGAAFATCGFSLESGTLRAEFVDTPEPASWVLLLTAVGAVVVRRVLTTKAT